MSWICGLIDAIWYDMCLGKSGEHGGEMVSVVCACKFNVAIAKY